MLATIVTCVQALALLALASLALASAAPMCQVLVHTLKTRMRLALVSKRAQVGESLGPRAMRSERAACFRRVIAHDAQMLKSHGA